MKSYYRQLKILIAKRKGNDAGSPRQINKP